jgi:hypothetical protein
MKNILFQVIIIVFLLNACASSKISKKETEQNLHNKWIVSLISGEKYGGDDFFCVGDTIVLLGTTTNKLALIHVASITKISSGWSGLAGAVLGGVGGIFIGTMIGGSVTDDSERGLLNAGNRLGGAVGGGIIGFFPGVIIGSFVGSQLSNDHIKNMRGISVEEKKILLQKMDK